MGFIIKISNTTQHLVGMILTAPVVMEPGYFRKPGLVITGVGVENAGGAAAMI